jgi:dTDP-4-dehydrorhamnose reductase
MLGTDLVDVVHGHGHDVTGVDRAEVDITVPGALASHVEGCDVVVNCAAWTAVDDAESHEAQAFALNATGAGLLASEAARAGARLVQISTDYVFDGTGTSPYPEDAPVAPRSAYGRTKAAGEWAVRALVPDHLVVRTAWLYGAHGSCFPKTIAAAGAEHGSLRVVDDQVGQPTWTRDLAGLVVALVEAGVPTGIYHGTSSGEVSWWGFAQEVVTAVGLHPQIVAPSATDVGARPAPRPAYSVLGHDALRRVGVEPIGPWDERWMQARAEVLAG